MSRTGATVPDELTFRIEFHGPFHIARGQAAAGLDRTVDAAVPLPASSLKGLLRAEAAERLGLDPDIVAEIFGSQRQPSPWAWSDGRPEQTPDVRRAARIRIRDALAGQAEDSFLMLGEQVWITAARFTISQIGPVADDRRNLHILVLQASAISVLALGGGRRRGDGWVTISLVKPERSWDETSTQSLQSLRAEKKVVAP